MRNERLSGETANETGETAADAPSGDRSFLSERLDRVHSGEASVALAASALALVAVVIRATVRLLANLPFDPVVATPLVRGTTAFAAPLFVTVALLCLAVTTREATVRVGLLFAGVFGALALVSPAATLPAVVAVVLGGGLTLVGTLGVPETWSARETASRLVAVGFVLGVGVALSSAVGILDGRLRAPGEILALAALAGAGVRSVGSPVAVGAGVVTVVGVILASAAEPFVLGSTLLVTLAVTGAPHLLVAVALGGGVAASVAGLRRGEYAPAVGAGLLLFAGVPVTMPRATTVLLGATLVVLGAVDGDGLGLRKGVKA